MSLRALTAFMSTETGPATHAVVGGGAGLLGDVGAGDHGFGGSAAGVDAGAAEELALDVGDGAASLGEASGERWAGLAGPDDDGVEVFGHQTLETIKRAPKMSNRVFDEARREGLCRRPWPGLRGRQLRRECRRRRRWLRR